MRKLFSFLFNLRVALFILLLAVMYLLSFNCNKPPMNGVVYGDPEGYYLYLPAVIIYHTFENIPVRTIAQYPVYPGTKKIFTKYTCGVAIMQSPFFLLAHIKQLIWNPNEATGYTLAYFESVLVATCFYTLLGLFVLFYYLRRQYSIIISLLTVVVIFGGTNLYYYSICQPGMSHAYSFFLFTLIVFYTPIILAGANCRGWMIYGLLYGLIILIRPTNTILIIYPILYGGYSFPLFSQRLSFFLSHKRYILLSTIILCIIFIPQFFYWKYLTGHFLFYSYNHESFIYWNRPKVWKVLFHVQNGWLLYSPILILALAGLVIGIKKRTAESLPTVLIIFIATYIFASWWAWWYGGAFGHRCYIEFYPLLALGLATFLSQVVDSKYASVIVGIVLSAGIYYNIRLTYMYVYFGGPWDGSSWTWYTFGEVLKKLI